ncbi:MAG: tetratricopeptide repeat protein, partial [Chroococcales cyanobacterium]
MGLDRSTDPGNSATATELKPESVDQPKDYQEWYKRASVLHDSKRYEEAIASYNQALEIRPHDYWACYERANALAALQRYQEAIASYDQA